MKSIKTTGLLLIAALAILSCKKSNDEKNTNWSQELKGTTWAGRFRYTSASNADVQPFSMVMNSDGTFTWTDLASTRPGGTWVAEGNKVTLKFPGNTTLSADLAKDSWSNFTSPTNIGFEMVSLSRVTVPLVSSFENTIWKGKFTRSDGISENVTIILLPGNSSTLTTQGSATAYPLTFQIAGAGLKLTVTTVGIIYFISPTSATAMEGYSLAGGGIFRYNWDLKKQ